MRNQKRKEYCFVRFSKPQYEEITKVAEAFGISIPMMLKEAFFKKNLRVPAMKQETANKLMSQLQILTTAVNTLSKELGTGFREGFHPPLDQASLIISTMKQTIAEDHGNPLD